MKKWIIIILLLPVSVNLFGQDYPQIPKFQKIEFGKTSEKKVPEIFPISPRFKTDTSLKKEIVYNGPDSVLLVRKYNSYHLNMPVAGGPFYSKMPVWVPDSTVNFAIKEKRIEFINELERNNQNRIQK